MATPERPSELSRTWPEIAVDAAFKIAPWPRLGEDGPVMAERAAAGEKTVFRFGARLEAEDTSQTAE